MTIHDFVLLSGWLVGIFGLFAYFLLSFISFLSGAYKRMLQYVMIMALCLICLGVAFDQAVRDDAAKRANYLKSAEYQQLVEKEGQALDDYLSQKDIAKDDAWWLNLQNAVDPDPADFFYDYREVLYKHLGGKIPANMEEFRRYNRNMAAPILFDEEIIVRLKPRAKTPITPITN